MQQGRHADPHPTEKEMDVLSCLWALGPATCEQVIKELSERFEQEHPYTTVASVLGTLVRKGWARRGKVGRAHQYQAILDREPVQAEALRRLLYSAFAGNRRLMIRMMEETY